MNTIKFTSKTTCRLNGVNYKGYLIGDLPNSFGFKEIYLGQDEDGNDQYKFGNTASAGIPLNQPTKRYPNEEDVFI